METLARGAVVQLDRSGAREKTVQQIAGMLNVPRSTVYGHLDKTKTVPCQPKKTAAAKP